MTKLNSKLSEAENAMKLLKNTKRELKEDLNVKALSLVIDRLGHDVNSDNYFVLADKSAWRSG